VTELGVASLKRSGMVIYQKLQHLSHYEAEKMSSVPSGEGILHWPFLQK